MIDPALYSTHQPLKVTPQHRQTARIEQQPVAPAAGRAGRTGSATGAGRAARVSPTARGGGAVRVVGTCCSAPAPAAAAGEGDLLVLAEDVELGGGKTQLRIGDGGGEGRRGWHWISE